MLIRELIEGRNLYRTYSDAGYYILQVETGIEYAEAVDVASANYTYVETTHKIEEEKEDTYNEEETTNTNSTL